jgi:Family of unknown function (DUF6464)
VLRSLPDSILVLDLYRSEDRTFLVSLPADGVTLGPYVEHQGETYAVLERSHQYNLRGGRYQLAKIALYVRPISVDLKDRVELPDKTWAIGDLTCVYNARSELLRCTPNPMGPCTGCSEFRPL